MSVLRSIAVTLILGISAYLGSVFIQGPFIWLAIVKPNWFRKWMDITTASWMTLAAATLELIGGIRMRHFGDPIRSGERAVLVLNHRTRLDWLYMWSIMVRCHTCCQEKIVLKDGLNRIMGPGWAMQCATFIFLKRQWEQDSLMLSQFMQYFILMQHQCQILIFPEGTNLTASTLARSDKFAEDNDQPKYSYVLHPRTTGFVHLVQLLRADKLSAVYDMTVGYPSNFPEKEVEFLSGNIPAQVDVHICRYDNESLPADDVGLARWLSSRWADKEQQLQSYYRGVTMRAASAATNTTSLCSDEVLFPNETSLCDESRLYLALTIVYWLAFMLLAVRAILYTITGLLLFLFLNALYLVLTRARGGVDKWAVEQLVKLNQSDGDKKR